MYTKNVKKPKNKKTFYLTIGIILFVAFFVGFICLGLGLYGAISLNQQLIYFADSFATIYAAITGGTFAISSAVIGYFLSKKAKEEENSNDNKPLIFWSDDGDNFKKETISINKTTSNIIKNQAFLKNSQKAPLFVEKVFGLNNNDFHRFIDKNQSFIISFYTNNVYEFSLIVSSCDNRRYCWKINTFYKTVVEIEIDSLSKPVTSFDQLEINSQLIDNI